MGSTYEIQSMIQEFEQAMGIGLVESILSEIPSMLISVAVYVFTALALHTIASRRGIKNPWLAWIPYANVWLMGCISDQYRSVARGQTKYRRRWLLFTEIANVVIGVLVIVLLFVMLFNVLSFGFGNLEKIAAISGVTNVFLDPVFEACKTETVAKPFTISSADMSYVTNVWHDLGYTGQGMTIAVLDTGLDVDHPSFAAAPAGASWDAERLQAILDQYDLNLEKLYTAETGKNISGEDDVELWELLQDKCTAAEVIV